MAVETTVEVVMPAMGDSVSEGTVLEWHKREGDQVSEDETLVEISTDKVDAEVPAPATGTVVKVHAAEGDTVHVGAVLAEIATNGAAPAQAPEAPEAPEAEEEPAGEAVEITMPAMGESVSEGVILEWAKQPGDPVEADETIVEISTDKVDAEVPAPASGVMEEILANPGDTVTVGQVIGRMKSGGNGAKPPPRPPRRPPRPPPEPVAEPEQGEEVLPDGIRISPVARRVAAAEGIDLSNVHGSGPGGRILKADVLGSNGKAAAAPRGAGAGERHADQGRVGDARALHGRVAVDPDRHLVPHAHRHHARRPPQGAQGRRPQGLLHPPDRLRDRPRRHRADAGDGPSLRRDRRQAAPRRRRRGQPRHRGRRREEGRRPHADGPGHPRRGAPELLRLPRRRSTT
jgi:2-oxoglutarate dehydrogenase E1 component